MLSQSKVFLQYYLSSRNSLGEIYFNDGIIGFSNLFLYSLYLLEKNVNHFLYILQSKVNSGVSFIIANPYFLMKEYHLNIDQEDFNRVELISEEDKKNNLQHFVILSLHANKIITANFLAPIILNRKKNIAAQVISLNTKFHTKHPIHMEKIKF